MKLCDLIKQLPDSLHNLARRFIRAYQRGDIDHPDELIEVATFLDSSPEGRAFVEAFCQKAVIA